MKKISKNKKKSQKFFLKPVLSTERRALSLRWRKKFNSCENWDKTIFEAKKREKMVKKKFETLKTNVENFFWRWNRKEDDWIDFVYEGKNFLRPEIGSNFFLNGRKIAQNGPKIETKNSKWWKSIPKNFFQHWTASSNVFPIYHWKEKIYFVEIIEKKIFFYGKSAIKKIKKKLKKKKKKKKKLFFWPPHW